MKKRPYHLTDHERDLIVDALYAQVHRGAPYEVERLASWLSMCYWGWDVSSFPHPLPDHGTEEAKVEA